MGEERPVAKETALLARRLLWAANRTQARGTTIRLVVPSAPEVTREMGLELSEARLLEVEEYLKDHAYLEPLDIGLTRGTYTMTPAGLRWLEAGASELAEAPREETDELRGNSDSRSAASGEGEDADVRPQARIPRRLRRELVKARRQLEEERFKERGRWRRMFGG